ncbi:MAG: N(4)-(beta-N-acetylglucosaminyl)-L-asparaginase [Sphingobacteriales bacterium]
MINRRKFLQLSALTAPLLSAKDVLANGTGGATPIVISTWAPNVKANTEAWKILGKGGRALDAVVAGVQVPEADPNDQSVGYGGLPDRDGKVTLDSCVMNEHGQCGSVMAIENIMHPVLVARLIMEKTPHVQLVGEGALQFALANGFTKENLLTPESEKAWKEWLKTSKYDPTITVENIKEKINNEDNLPYQWPLPQLNHDTIGMVALDSKGNLGGACTTSGMAYKMHGRVGDSPVIGAGLFVDNEVGAASSTGVGEEVIKICGSHTVVEMMRHGYSPEAACKEAVRRIAKNNKGKTKDLQVGFLAINKKGEHGAFAIMKGFTYCVTTNAGTKVIDAKSFS